MLSIWRLEAFWLWYCYCPAFVTLLLRFLFFFFLMWTIFKDFIEFVTMFLLFYILLPVAVWHAPCPGIEPSPPALAVQPPDC